jgi:hypothetical protein
MHRHLTLALCAAATAVVFGLAGCSSDKPTTATSGSSDTSLQSTALAAPTTPLPPPDALTDVLTRLTDPNVPGANKVSLIEGATSDSADTIDRFTTALRDNGYMPMTFTATNLAWSDKNPADVMAAISVNNTRGNNGIFNFPMEFAPSQGGWQLARRTADMLLALGNSSSIPPAAPSPSPAPPPVVPPPAPAPAEQPAPPR